eukprot:gnl/Trimastix_PCT/338.p2 GENE.gnl/Trimastix_PCT/338~~gnl/Trimastix_PCT/338.p2  ORF type:complete len:529 (+),score=173.72 gnl/Trimastix_PCT/338:50-1588(+)
MASFLKPVFASAQRLIPSFVRSLGTVSGNRGLNIDEPIVFERGQENVSAVRLPAFEPTTEHLGGMERKSKMGLPGLSEPEVMRHYVKLSTKNYSIDHGMYPLGSCTMKYNPRLNEIIARIPGFSQVHPMQPQSTAQGALEAMHLLSEALLKITGMHGVTLNPSAGSHGEHVALMMIRKALLARGDQNRKVVLVPSSAHGTNPASSAMTGFKVRQIEILPGGSVDMESLKRNLGPDVAALMLTNPSTVGMFEKDCIEISRLVREAGAYFYMDGANFNALFGRMRPADIGVDAMHFNLHKSFSTPHGGGGPGSGPVVFSERLASHAPIPSVHKNAEGRYELREDITESSIGRVKAFHGQVGVMLKALSYIMALGDEGLRRSSGDAVMNANYILARLRGTLSPAFESRCMHEALFTDEYLKGTGVSTLDMAKALIDEGFHPPTMYFPLVVSGAFLVEPTESESKLSLDRFCDTLIKLVERIRKGETDYFHQTPVHTPIRRADEARAAINPVLVHD